MSRPVDLVLAKLDAYHLRENGRDRWRSCCPGHGGSNRSALSIGVGENDAVLLRCWHGCDVEQIVSALGLGLSDLFPPKLENSHGAGPLKRRRMLTPGQALELLEGEITLTLLCASDLARGEALDEPTRARLLHGAARVALLRDEVRA